ncbi:hypothetical protein, partial [Salmonella enterica]|uniref:hypothetical protein n=1 Tax=Salmonella enterica TaxID=28901 RepID=UPI002A75587A
YRQVNLASLANLHFTLRDDGLDHVAHPNGWPLASDTARSTWHRWLTCTSRFETTASITSLIRTAGR